MFLILIVGYANILNKTDNRPKKGSANLIVLVDKLQLNLALPVRWKDSEFTLTTNCSLLPVATFDGSQELVLHLMVRKN